MGVQIPCSTHQTMGSEWCGLAVYMFYNHMDSAQQDHFTKECERILAEQALRETYKQELAAPGYEYAPVEDLSQGHTQHNSHSQYQGSVRIRYDQLKSYKAPSATSAFGDDAGAVIAVTAGTGLSDDFRPQASVSRAYQHYQQSGGLFSPWDQSDVRFSHSHVCGEGVCSTALALAWDAHSLRGRADDTHVNRHRDGGREGEALKISTSGILAYPEWGQRSSAGADRDRSRRRRSRSRSRSRSRIRRSSRDRLGRDRHRGSGRNRSRSRSGSRRKSTCSTGEMAAVPHVSEAAPTVAVERLVTAADVGLVTTVPEGRAQARASGKHPHHVSLARWVLGGGTSIVEKERAVMVRDARIDIDLPLPLTEPEVVKGAKLAEEVWVRLAQEMRTTSAAALATSPLRVLSAIQAALPTAVAVLGRTRSSTLTKVPCSDRGQLYPIEFVQHAVSTVTGTPLHTDIPRVVAGLHVVVHSTLLWFLRHARHLQEHAELVAAAGWVTANSGSSKKQQQKEEQQSGSESCCPG
ncbi:MAG: hypothetical protein WDW38_006671 [Sanguina aurantia]